MFSKLSGTFFGSGAENIQKCKEHRTEKLDTDRVRGCVARLHFHGVGKTKANKKHIESVFDFFHGIGTREL